MQNHELGEPFVYDLNLLARESYNWLDYQKSDEIIKSAIDEVVDEVKKFVERSSVGPFLSRINFSMALLVQLRGEGIEYAAGVGYMIVTDHPYLNGWEENDKRFLLDLAICKGLATWEEAKVFPEYYPKEHPKSSLADNQIARYRSLQSRLRQRISPPLSDISNR